jgi:FAD:protein FMN transferase
MQKNGATQTLADRLKYAAGTLGLTLLFLCFVGEPDRFPEPETPAPARATIAPATIGATNLAVRPPPSPPPVFDEAHRFQFAREGVLGTSFDLTVIADHSRQAAGVETRILQEIAKREKLVSTYRTDSEISRLNFRPFAAGERIDVSYSLWLLLDECRGIHRRSAGAFNAFAGNAVRLWREAGKTGRRPDEPALKKVALGTSAGFQLSSKKNETWVRRLTPGTFDLDAIGKGYIIDKCVREAVADFPSIRGLRLNIGGEIKVWGQADYARNRSWRLGVADPLRPADNAAPVTELDLRNLAVATSGDYARALRVAGRHVNHLLDPRTARPVDHVRSATVVAASAARADALATALCVMTPAAGVAMIEAMSEAACLIIDREGRQFRSAAFASLEVPATVTATGAWPAQQVVTLNFELVRSEKRAPFHRHYVGAWVENEAGRRIRILALWAKPGDISYTRDLDEFWRDAWILAGEGNDTRRLVGFSRATRAPGEYSLTWDGLNDAGQPVPQGRYTIHLDVNREKGPPSRRERHTHSHVTLPCLGQSASATAEDRPELRNVRARYGPVGGGARP